MEEVLNKITGVSNSDDTSLLMDKSGRIIALSGSFQQLIRQALPNADFFTLFDEKNKELLQGVFNSVKKNESPAGDFIHLIIDNKESGFQFSISPLRSEKNIYFLVNFSQSDKMKSSGGKQKFWIASKDLDNLTDDNKLKSVFEKIKLTYPFTFIEKAKIQKEINELNLPFWLKDTAGKYLLVNGSFSEGFGFKPNQIENKKEDDFLPGYLIELYKTIDQYLIKSRNAVIAEGISVPMISGSEKNVSLAELPLCDLDDNVVAIIGFAKKEIPHANYSQNANTDMILNLPFPLMIINREKKIVGYSKVMIRWLNLEEKSSYINTDLSKLIEKGLLRILEDYLKKEDTNEEFFFNYVFADRVNMKTEVHVRKIDLYEGFSGCIQIGFYVKSTDDEVAEV